MMTAGAANRIRLFYLAQENGYNSCKYGSEGENIHRKYIEGGPASQYGTTKSCETFFCVQVE